GQLRQYLPHGTNLRSFTQEHLDDNAASLNSRPRKTHGFTTPSAKLSEALH
ncbi:MAG: family transposase, partial [Frankiales bacterium]|nr:family transposase [Frankiales bacterium]